MTTIKAPYNFVPFNKDVVSPHWIDQISHDIPFKDGQSGTIEVMIKAMSPIFVRDGIGQRKAKENYDGGIQQNPHLFSQYGERYFIPGTSIKGMIRNVLEILSFGRMGNKVNDHRYAVRDFQNKKLYDPSKISQNVKCGWLSLANGEYILQDCGKPRRISHKTLSENFGINISDFFQIKSNLGNKSAKLKYDKYPTVLGSYRFETWDDKNGRPMCTVNPNGSFMGTIVFTGQPSERVESLGQGKHLEFVFQNVDTEGQPVPEQIIENFFFAYYEHDRNKQSPDWKYWKPKLDAGEKIPVFFRRENGVMKDIGLSMLYKIAYENSVVDAITYYQGECKPDLSEAIFGHVDKNNALKGRVHIGHAFAKHAEIDTEKQEVLSGPKASYYPNYMRQSSTVNHYKTFMDEGAEIAGWKRYPVHTNGVKHNPPPEKNNSEKILTKFIPLKAGAEFTFSIRYHNLRPVELGALFSALTFHGAENTFHSIGMAKPLGYGKVIVSIENEKALDIPKYLGLFEAYMNFKLGKTDAAWHKNEQVVELATMAQNQANADLAYMKLPEHISAKKNKEILDKYSKIISNQAIVPSFCDANAIAAMKRNCDKEAKQYLHSSNVEEVVKMTQQAAKDEVHRLFEERKSLLLRQLAEKRAAVKNMEQIAHEAQKAAEQAKKEAEEAQQRAETKAQRQAETQAQGLDLSGINSSGRNAFDELKRAVEKYARDYHSLNEKQLKINFPDGYLPERDHNAMLTKIKEIYNAGKGTKLDVIIKKVAEWIGEEKAKTITFK